MIDKPKNKRITSSSVSCSLEFSNSFKARGNESLLKAQKIVDSEVVRLNDKYIRLASGELRKSFARDTTLGSGEYISNSPYALKDYYNENVTPSVMRDSMTGGRHFERMKNRHLDEIKANVEKGVKWLW